MSRDLRAASRDKWASNTESLSLEQINTGSMLRVADAVELMAQSHQKLINERDMYKRMFEAECGRVEQLNNQVRSLRGVITRMKRKAESTAPSSTEEDAHENPISHRKP